VYCENPWPIPIEGNVTLFAKFRAGQVTNVQNRAGPKESAFLIDAIDLFHSGKIGGKFRLAKSMAYQGGWEPILLPDTSYTCWCRNY